MLVLIEPFIYDELVDRPDLGCGMLLGACKKNQIRYKFIHGQPQILRFIFLNGVEEISLLLKELPKETIKSLHIEALVHFIQTKGVKESQAEFTALYNAVIASSNFRDYLYAEKVEKVGDLYRCVCRLYTYQIDVLNNKNIGIIDVYVKEILKSNPKYVAFSLRMRFDPLTRVLREEVKKHLDVPIVVGGSLTPYIKKDQLYDLFKKEIFDYLIIGAGEHALPILIASLESKKTPVYSNICYLDNNKLVVNKVEVVKDLDRLAFPDFSQFDLDSYLAPVRILPLQTARGCSWKKCAFCSHYAVDGNHYVTLSMNKLVKTIEYYRDNYHCCHIAFHDAEISPARAEKISYVLIKNGLNNLYYNMYARMDRRFNRKVFTLMYRAGFRLVHWGFESASQKILDSMQKGTCVLDMERILKENSESKIANICFVIFGFPGETETDLIKTVKFLQKNSRYIDDVIISNFILDSDSPVGKQPEKWGIMNINKDGEYEVRNGHSPRKTKKFLSKLKRDMVLNQMNFTNKKLRFVPLQNTRRMLRFLISCCEPVDELKFNSSFRIRELKNLYPLALGSVKGNYLYYIDLRETVFVNNMILKKKLYLTKLNKKIFSLCDTRQCISKIVDILKEEFRNNYDDKKINKKVVSFLETLRNYGSVIFFSSSWGVCYSLQENKFLKLNQDKNIKVDK